MHSYTPLFNPDSREPGFGAASMVSVCGAYPELVVCILAFSAVVTSGAVHNISMYYVYVQHMQTYDAVHWPRPEPGGQGQSQDLGSE
jgi:hypothetical protein